MSRYFTGVRGGFLLHAAGSSNILRSFKGTPDSSVRGFACSSDGNVVAAHYYNGTVELWSVSEPEPRLKVSGSPSKRCVATFHAKASLAMISAPGEPLFLFDHGTGERRPTGISSRAVIALRIEPAGGRLAVVSTNSVEIWDIAFSRRVWSQSLDQALPWCAWSPNGQLLAVGTQQTKELKILSSGFGTALTRLSSHQLSPAGWEFHPDGRRLAC